MHVNGYEIKWTKRIISNKQHRQIPITHLSKKRKKKEEIYYCVSWTFVPVLTAVRRRKDKKKWPARLPQGSVKVLSTPTQFLTFYYVWHYIIKNFCDVGIWSHSPLSGCIHILARYLYWLLLNIFYKAFPPFHIHFAHHLSVHPKNPIQPH